MLEKRLPRVSITYDVSEDSISNAEIPVIVGVIGDFYGNKVNKPNYRDRYFININRDNFDIVMRDFSPTFKMRLNYAGKEIEIILILHNLSAFEPGNIIKNIRSLDSVLNERRLLGDLLLKLGLNPQLIIDLENNAVDTNNYPHIYNLNEMIRVLNIHLQDNKKNIMSLIKEAIYKINHSLGELIDQIIHNPDFQTLEAKWRNLYRLTSFVKDDTGVKIFSCTKEEMLAELSLEYEQSTLFHQIYERAYGTVGGTPFACLVLDEYIDQNDIDFLRFISKICEAAHAPILTSASPSLFSLKSFTQLNEIKDLEMAFSSMDLAEWEKFREELSTRYINIVLPKVLTRSVYKIGSRSIDMFAYEEKINSYEDLCWGNAAYCLAERILEAFTKHGWTAAIRGSEGGGVVKELPLYSFNSLYNESRATEAYITDRRENELSKLGFISLCHKLGSNDALFFGGQSMYKTKNDVLTPRIAYVLSASRFAHYIKMMLRHKIGSFQSAAQIEVYLQNWLGGYVLLSDGGDANLKARYPLREGRIWVEDGTTPGEYKMRMEVKPHFQLEGIKVSISFVTKFRNDK